MNALSSSAITDKEETAFSRLKLTTPETVKLTSIALTTIFGVYATVFLVWTVCWSG